MIFFCVGHHFHPTHRSAINTANCDFGMLRMVGPIVVGTKRWRLVGLTVHPVVELKVKLPSGSSCSFSYNYVPRGEARHYWVRSRRKWLGTNSQCGCHQDVAVHLRAYFG